MRHVFNLLAIALLAVAYHQFFRSQQPVAMTPGATAPATSNGSMGKEAPSTLTLAVTAGAVSGVLIQESR